MIEMALVRGTPTFLLRCCFVIGFVLLTSLLGGSLAGRVPRFSSRWRIDAASSQVKPESTFHGFPEKLWQKTSTWSFSKDIEADIQSWRDKNPSFNFDILDDERSDNFIRQKYRQRPEIVNMYLSLRIPIVKADLFRYLVLYSEGGVWSDLDVACEQSVRGWIPPEYLDRANLVVGIEGLQDYKGPRVALGSQFASWTVMAKPGSKHLLYVIESIRERLASIAQLHGVGWKHLELGMLSDVVDDSGPYKMTRGILESLFKQTGRMLDDRDLAKIKNATLVGDVLILPGAAFAAGQNKYPMDQGDFLVTHHYAGSWKAEADHIRLQKVVSGRARRK